LGESRESHTFVSVSSASLLEWAVAVVQSVSLLVEPEALIGSSETQSSVSGCGGSAHQTVAPPPPHVTPTELTVESASEPSPTMAAPVDSPKEASSASAAAPMGLKVVGDRESAPLSLERLNGKEKIEWKVASGKAPSSAHPPPRTSWCRSSAVLSGLREADAARAGAGASVWSLM